VRVSAVVGAALIAVVLLGAVAAPPAAAFDGITWTSRASTADNNWRTATACSSPSPTPAPVTG
jgi:hypothetical protein